MMNLVGVLYVLRGEDRSGVVDELSLKRTMMRAVVVAGEGLRHAPVACPPPWWCGEVALCDALTKARALTTTFFAQQRRRPHQPPSRWTMPTPSHGLRFKTLQSHRATYFPYSHVFPGIAPISWFH